MSDKMNELAMDVIRDRVAMIEKFSDKRLAVRREGDAFYMSIRGQMLKFANATEILCYLSGMQEMIEYK